jgi:hypothetical protein
MINKNKSKKQHRITERDADEMEIRNVNLGRPVCPIRKHQETHKINGRYVRGSGLVNS